MEIIAKLNNLRVSPRKVRLIVNLIRGLDVAEAQKQLHFLVKKSAEPILKLLNSAVANAKHNFKVEADDLYISKIFVDGGAVLKRFMPRAFGRTSAIHKRTSHINLTLSLKKDKNGVMSSEVAEVKSDKKVKKTKSEKKVDDQTTEVIEIKKALSSESEVKPKKQGKKSAAPKSTGKRLTGLARRAFKPHNAD